MNGVLHSLQRLVVSYRNIYTLEYAVEKNETFRNERGNGAN